MQITRPSIEEKKYLRYLVYQYARLHPICYLYALSILIRFKHCVQTHEYRPALAACLNIALFFLGPQSVCKNVCIFRSDDSLLFLKRELRELHRTLLGYTAAEHLPQWQIARSIQWHIVLNVLNGRIL